MGPLAGDRQNLDLLTVIQTVNHLAFQRRRLAETDLGTLYIGINNRLHGTDLPGCIGNRLVRNG